MNWPWKRPKPDPVAAEVSEQAARSKEALDRVEVAVKKASEIIEDYNAADRARVRRDP